MNWLADLGGLVSAAAGVGLPPASLLLFSLDFEPSEASLTVGKLPIDALLASFGGRPSESLGGGLASYAPND